MIERMMDDDEWGLIAPTFTPQEVARTGADPSTVTVSLMRSLAMFRQMVGHPVYLINNGLTTGEHTSLGHGLGLAADVYTDKSVGYRALFDAASDAGFRKIGIYWNGIIYSCHLELHVGPRALWSAYKDQTATTWVFRSLIVDPAWQFGAGVWAHE